MSENVEEMPCPRCKKKHPKGKYVPRPELAKKPLGEKVLRVVDGVEVRSGTPFAPPDVQCDCGATLRHIVPIFAVDPYGWRWESHND